MRTALTNDESKVLFKKYINQDLTTDEANYKLSTIKQHLRGFVASLQAKKLKDEEISTRFKMEFEKICMKAEVGN